MSLFILVIDLLGFVFISMASLLLVLVFLEYFKGLKIPAFWIYFVIAFYLSVTATFLDAAFQRAELTQTVRLLSNVFIFLGIYGAYRRMNTKL